MKTRVLGIDPGAKNFAYGLLEDGKYSTSGKFVPINKVTYEDLCAWSLQIHDFLASLKLNPESDWIAIERYAQRGMYKSFFEPINLMVGIFIREAMPIIIDLQMASTWKTWMKKTYKIEPVQIYPGTNDHEACALCLAEYSYTKALKDAN